MFPEAPHNYNCCNHNQQHILYLRRSSCNTVSGVANVLYVLKKQVLYDTSSGSFHGARYSTNLSTVPALSVRIL